MDYPALQAELTADPLARGYAAMTDAQAVTSLTTANRSVARAVIPAREVIEATVPAEWAALTAQEKQRYALLTGAGEISVKGANTRASFLAMFGAGTATRAASGRSCTRSGAASCRRRSPNRSEPRPRALAWTSRDGTQTAEAVEVAEGHVDDQ